MAQQLPLTNPATGPVGSVRSAWKLDEKTRESGRRGIASARAALAAHRPDDSDRRSAA